MSNNSDQQIESVATSLSIVEHLSNYGPATISEIANELSIPRSTVHIHLKTLSDYGQITRKKRGYDIGLRPLQYGARARRRYDVYKSARKTIDELSEKVHEAVIFGVEQNGNQAILYKSERGNAMKIIPTGEFTNMHWTAIGKVILAHYTSDQIEDIISEHGLPRATDHTITSSDELLNELEEIRKQGYAIENEERKERVVSVATPIFDTEEEEVVAGLALIGPRERMKNNESDNIKPDLLESLQNAASIIELRYNQSLEIGSSSRRN